MFQWLKKKSGNILMKYEEIQFSQSVEIFYKYFTKNPIVNRAITTIAQQTTNKLSKLNYTIDFYPIIIDLLVTGNAFINKKDMSIIKSQHIEIKYQYKTQEIIEFIHNQKKYTNDEIIHIKQNAQHPIGQSPLESLQLTIETHTASIEFLYQFIKNGGRPTGIFTYSHFLTPNKTREIHHEIIKTQKEQSIGLIEGDLKWTSIGQTPQDIDLLSYIQNLESRIANNLGVPALLLDIKDAKFNNYHEANSVLENNINHLYQNIKNTIKIHTKEIIPNEKNS